jgi:type I restriction enzyme M protein
MDITTLESWLWEAACSIRGPLDAPKYKDYILPLLFYKRLCDVFDDELAHAVGAGDGILAKHLYQYPELITRDPPDEDVPSVNIFGESSTCAQWRRRV